MDNEEDYIELHRLLAKCKWNMAREQVKFPILKRIEDETVIETPITEFYEKKTRQIDEFIVDIPIIIKGDER